MSGGVVDGQRFGLRGVDSVGLGSGFGVGYGFQLGRGVRLGGSLVDGDYGSPCVTVWCECLAYE